MSGSLQLPNWNNTLLDLPGVAQAVGGVQARQLANQGTAQDLSDRQAVRDLVPGLAANDPTAIATASTLGPYGANALSGLGAGGKMQAQNLANQGAQMELSGRQLIRDNAQGLASGDPTATAAALGANPQLAGSFMQSLASMQGAQREQTTYNLGASGDLAETVLNAPSEKRAQVWADGRQSMQTSGHTALPPAQYPGDAAMYTMRGLALHAKEQLSMQQARLTTSTDGPLAFPSYADGVVGHESAGNPNAKNPLSSATGQGQFLNGTWLNEMKQNRPDLTQGQTDDQILAMRTNPQLSRQMVNAYGLENGQALRTAGLPVNNGNLYLAHGFGPDGARAILSADPNTPIESALGTSAVNANPNLRGKTTGQVAQMYQQKMAGTPSLISSSVAGGGAPSPSASVPRSAPVASIAPAAAPAPTQMASAFPVAGGQPTITDAVPPPAMPSADPSAAPQNALASVGAPQLMARPGAPTSPAIAQPSQATAPNPMSPVSSDVAALGNGIATAGGAVPQPAGLAAAPPQEGPRPGELWLRNPQSGAIAPASKEGYGFVKDAKGNMAERRIPGSPGAGVDTKIEGGKIISTDKTDGHVVSIVDGAPDTSRVTTVAGPNGNQIWQSGHQIANLPFSTQPAQIDAWKKDQDLAHTVAQQNGQAEQQLQQVLEGRDLAKGLPTGTGGQSRAAISNWLQTYAPSSVYDSFVKGGYLPDAAQAQEAAKVFLKQAGTDEKNQGGSGGLGLTQMYASANPNLDLSPKAIQDISNLKAVSAQANKDYGDGFLNHFNTQADNLLHKGGSYDSTSNFDQQWYGQKNVRTYLAATNAMNGKPYAEWSKNLAPEDQARALSIIGRIDPSTEINGAKGKIGVDGNPVAFSAPQASGGVQSAAPLPQAIEMLRGNPSLAGSFDQKYGAGASQRALGQSAAQPSPASPAAPQAATPFTQGASFPSNAVNMLRANPSLAAHFDAKYGAGASQRVLGQ